MPKKSSSASDTVSSRIESQYQPGLLRQCIADGLSLDEMMVRLSILHKSTLRKHILRLMDEDKTFYDIDNLFSRSSNLPKVNPKGRLTLNLRGMIIGGETVKANDVFKVHVEEDRITITRA